MCRLKIKSSWIILYLVICTAQFSYDFLFELYV